MALAYIIDHTGYISIATEENGEYWTGAHKHDMTKVRVATDAEVKAFDAERDREIRAGNAYMASFGITDFGPRGSRKQPKQYAAMVAADRADPEAFDRFVETFER